MKPGAILVATLPWKESLINNMNICPKCGHEFHRVGHFHSYKDISEMFDGTFQIVTICFINSRSLQNKVLQRWATQFSDYLFIDS